MSAKKFVVLPEWMTALKDRMNHLEDEMRVLLEKMAHLEVMLQKMEVLDEMEDDVKSLKQIVHERENKDPLIASYLKGKAAQGLPTPNVPIIAGAKRTRALGHPRKSIHDNTLCFDNKITPIEKDPNII